MTGVIASFIFSVNYNMVTDSSTVDANEVKMLHSILAGIISVVSMYVGAAIQEKRDKE
jgi:hypothetical protein